MMQRFISPSQTHFLRNFRTKHSKQLRTATSLGCSTFSLVQSVKAFRNLSTSTQQQEQQPRIRTENDKEFSFQTDPATLFVPSEQHLPWSWSSPVEHYIPPPPPPSMSFVWPPQVEKFCRQLYTLGYDHKPRPYNPNSFLTYLNSTVGKNEYETFTCHLPQHPSQPGPCPDLSTVVPHDSPLLSHPSCPTEDAASSTYSICHVGPYGCGPPNCVHGGLIASLFDVISYRAITDSGRPAMTANLNIDYRRPIPIGHPWKVFVTARFASERKSIVSIGAFSDDLSQLYAEGKAIFVVPKNMMDKTAYDYSVVGHVDPLANQDKH